MNEKKVEWALRIAIFGTFLGHGIFALSIKKSWFPYFTGIGIVESIIPTLLLLIGTMDVIVSLFALFKPVRIVLLWATIWSFVTALIRPITSAAGFFSLDFMDFVERAANFMAPLALLLFYGWPKKISGWFSVRN